MGMFFWYRASRASTGLSKHGSPCYRRFDDFHGACARGGRGMVKLQKKGFLEKLWPGATHSSLESPLLTWWRRAKGPDSRPHLRGLDRRTCTVKLRKKGFLEKLWLGATHSSLESPLLTRWRRAKGRVVDLTLGGWIAGPTWSNYQRKGFLRSCGLGQHILAWNHHC